MPSLSELASKLSTEKLDHDIADLTQLPEQMGMRTPTLQPGPYIFELPALAALREAFDVVDDGKILVVKFRDDAALKIVQAPDASLNGKPHGNSITSRARARGRGDNAPKVSDLDYLLSSLGDTKRPTTLKGYGDQVLLHAGKRFGADIELSYYCNDKRPVRLPTDDGTGTITMDGQEGRGLQNGCGARFYQKDVEKQEDGKYPTKLGCNCGAVLYANENLTRFRKVTA